MVVFLLKHYCTQLCLHICNRQKIYKENLKYYKDFIKIMINLI
ncbi:hypothetical protein Cassandra_0141 [Pseudomonas phage Cassandra]|nr:hypothetical protein Cassandra_0141 [Pseudomonas phage Cassandra]WPK39338.1 hypothetical protein Deiofobo_0141 [Pseudomonas phage Deifobo]